MYVFFLLVSLASPCLLIWLRAAGSQWYAVFSFWLILVLFFIWMLVMAAQVSQNVYE